MISTYGLIYLMYLIWNKSTKMAAAENLSLYSSLLGEDLSIWSIDDHAKQFGDGASLDIHLVDPLVSVKPDSTDIVEGDQSDPLPEWMSEKIDVNDWLENLDRPVITHELQMNKMSEVDDIIGQYDLASPDYMSVTSLDEELPLSPGNSIGSCGTAVNSSMASPAPSSPLSPASSSGFLETEPASSSGFLETEDAMMADVESLINSCTDADTFLQLADSITLQLPLPSEDDIAPLLADVTAIQTDLQGKIKTEATYRGGAQLAVSGGVLPAGSRSAAGKPKSKAVSKERKERKKGQNKEAATRYRQKKKKETEMLSQELGSLEKTNTDLKDKVGSLEKEISYLKELLQEIYKVKGQIKLLKSP